MDSTDALSYQETDTTESNESCSSSSIDSGEEEDQQEDNEEDENDCSLADNLQKFGYDYKSLLTVTFKKTENGTNIKLKPPLTASLFLNVPPTINFVTHDEKLSEMPESLKRLCKWKMCSITPNIVKATIARSNFRLASSLIFLFFVINFLNLFL